MRFFLMLALSVALVGCGDNSKLSRGKAKDLIQENAKFITVMAIIPHEARRLSWNGSHVLDSELNTIFSAMAREGVINFKDLSGRTGGYVYQVSLAEKGRPYLLADSRANFAVKLCERKIQEVSGIEQPTEKLAKVHFTYTTTKPTPFGATAPKICAGVTGNANAILQLFDDGWRISEVRMIKNGEEYSLQSLK